jgi:hypothetical protein
MSKKMCGCDKTKQSSDKSIEQISQSWAADYWYVASNATFCLSLIMGHKQGFFPKQNTLDNINELMADCKPKIESMLKNCHFLEDDNCNSTRVIINTLILAHTKNVEDITKFMKENDQQIEA